MTVESAIWQIKYGEREGENETGRNTFIRVSQKGR